MDFVEQLAEINNFKTFSDVSWEFDFLKDYEDMCLEDMFNTNLKEKRKTNYTDDELVKLHDAFDKKVDELLAETHERLSEKYGDEEE